MGDTNSTSGNLSAHPPMVDPSSLEHIVDETEEIGDCRSWIYAEFVAGRDADSILAELIGNGWPTDDAEGLVEEGRRATRHLRGVVTRDEVARVAEKRYRNSFRMAFRLALGGLPLMCVHFLGSLLTARRNPWPDRMRGRHGEKDEGANATSPDSDSLNQS